MGAYAYLLDMVEDLPFDDRDVNRWFSRTWLDEALPLIRKYGIENMAKWAAIVKLDQV